MVLNLPWRGVGDAFLFFCCSKAGTSLASKHTFESLGNSEIGRTA
jgi:hypothetical protein